MAKKKPMSDAERVAAYRERQAEKGIQKVELQLPEATIRKLDQQAKRADLSRSDLVKKLINAPKPKRDK